MARRLVRPDRPYVPGRLSCPESTSPALTAARKDPERPVNPVVQGPQEPREQPQPPGEEGDPGQQPATLTERLVEVLAEATEGVTSSVLATALGEPAWRVRRELTDLELVGMVYRRGKKRWTRWYLG